MEFRKGQWVKANGKIGILIPGEGIHLVDPETGETLMDGPNKVKIAPIGRVVPAEWKDIPKARRPKK